MNNRLIALLVAVLVSLGLGYWALQQQGQEVEVKSPVFADLADSANSLTEVRISNAQQVLLNATRRESGWVATHLDNAATYPVAQQRLAELVKGVVDARLLEAKTTREEKYSRLGVESLDSEDSQATLVELTSGDKVWQLLVGNTAKSGAGSYVREPQKRQSWLLDSVLSLPASDTNWLRQPVLSIDVAEVASVQRLGENGWTVEKSTPEQANFTLLEMPEGRSLQYGSVLDGAASTITSLRFDALQPYSEEFWQTLEPKAQQRLTTFDGKSVELSLASAEETSYVRLSGGDANAYYQDWLFEVSSFTADQLSRGMEDFLAEPEDNAEQGPPVPDTN